MSTLILFNKPFRVLSQFTEKNSPEGSNAKETLKNYLDDVKDCYPAGRLDYDSEGLLLLTNDGVLQHQITDPSHKLPKVYLVQVEGIPSDDALQHLARGVLLKDGLTKPAKARRIAPFSQWSRNPPIRQRKNIADSWIELTITEGKNRQVRRMVAAVGHPCLRLIRSKIGRWSLDDLEPGQWRKITVHSPRLKKNSYRRNSRTQK